MVSGFYKLQKVSKLNGWKAEDERKSAALESLKMIWESLKQKADTNSVSKTNTAYT